MDKRRHKRVSKFLSYILRHHPESIGIALDSRGWVDVAELLRAAGRSGVEMTLEELRTVVKEDDKQRFAFSGDGLRIRANQGHSIPVDLGYDPVIPPDVLYHGTARRRLDSIRRQGLLRGARHDVHLSPDPVTAKQVGRRYGKPVVIEIQAGKMHADGHKFYLSANGIWLTGHVPPSYMRFPDNEH